MFGDKTLRKLVFGKCKLINGDWRTTEINFPKTSDDDKDRKILFPGDDGVVLYLIKTIEKLEERITNLENKKTNGKK